MRRGSAESVKCGASLPALRAASAAPRVAIANDRRLPRRAPRSVSLTHRLAVQSDSFYAGYHRSCSADGSMAFRLGYKVRPDG